MSTGLQIMHKYGIIHRDISAGNVLEFNGKGKVGDLEFAIEMDDEGSHEIRTVCSCFFHWSARLTTSFKLGNLGLHGH
jgi:serine/threonine protein kinase